MFNLDTYSYVYEFYYRKTLSAIYSDCIQPVGTNLDWRVEDVVMKTLPPVFKRQVGRPIKQRIPSVGEFNNLSRCSNYNSKGHNSMTCKQSLNN